MTTAGLALAAPRTVTGQAGQATRGPVALPYFDVRKYGATGDGKTKDTAALQRAVDECTAGGGGVVYLPPGAYLSGTVILKDNVTFHCESVTNLWVERLEAAAPGNAQPLMRLVNLRDALVSVCSAPSQSGAAVEVAGAESAGVRLLGDDFGRAAKAVEMRNGAPAVAVE